MATETSDGSRSIGDAHRPLREGESEAEAGEFAEDGRRLRHVVRDPDVLDTWFSSGIWPIGTLGWPEDTPELRRYYPTSVLVTGFDILFFWVARMMMMQLELDRRGAVPRRLHPPARPRREGQEDVEVARQHPRPDRAHRRVRRRRRPLHPGRDGGDGPRRQAQPRPHRRLPQLRHQALERRPLRRDERLPPRPGLRPAAVTLTANKWIVGETGRLRETLDAALDAYRFNDAASAALRPRLGQGLRLVRRAGEAALRRRRRRRDPRHHGLGARPVPDPDAPGHAVHHRGALGPDRRPRRSCSPTPTGPTTAAS